MSEMRVGEVEEGTGLSFVDLACRRPSTLRSVQPDEVAHPGDLVAALEFHAVNAIELLSNVDPTTLDPSALTQWAHAIERVRRMCDASAVDVADHLDCHAPFRHQGFSAKGWMQHRLKLSGPESFRRLQVARLHRRVPAWDEASELGSVGVAQTELMARVAANPRVPESVLERDAPMLLQDAQELSFDQFERRVRTWEALADPHGDRHRTERQKAAREFRARPRPEGGWTLSGSLDELAGSEFTEILAHFVDAEWRTDWAEARSRLGDSAQVTDLCRTAAQRQADALLAMAKAAAGSRPGGNRPGPTVNYLIDADTFEATLRGESVDPQRYRDVVCRTQRGRRLSRDDVVNTALTDHIRRVVIDSASTVIDLGHRSRLFRGAARDAIMLLATRCVWLGCDQPVAWCQADHSLSWAAHGATVPRNGAPLCRHHNLLKERGFQVYRDHDGHWHFVDPDGNTIR